MLFNKYLALAVLCLIGFNFENLYGMAYGGHYENCVQHLIYAENEDPQLAQEICSELCPYNTHTCMSREEYEYYENCEANKDIEEDNDEDEGEEPEDEECP